MPVPAVSTSGWPTLYDCERTDLRIGPWLSRKPMGSSVSTPGDGSARSWTGAVGDGTTSLSREARPSDGLVKLFMFHSVDGPARDGNSSDGVVGCEPARDTDGRENLRLGWMSWSQPPEGRRADGSGCAGARAGGT